MKIKYDMGEINGICKTPCPHKKTGLAGDDIVMVGSSACQKCKHHFRSNEPDTILCSNVGRE